PTPPEFVLLDAKAGKREAAFDHGKLAEALKKAGIEDARADRLPIDRLEFKTADGALLFRAGGQDWRCALASYALTKIKAGPAATERPAGGLRAGGPRVSSRTGEETELTFVHRTSGEGELFWLDTSGGRKID